MSHKILPIILCGGTGSRLWPLSRASFPKQYLDIDKNEKISFLQGTLNRIRNFEEIDAPIIVCNDEHRFITAEQLRNIKINAKSILLEPIGRNTAPAITAACLKANEDNTDPNILVLPADHIIQDNQTFHNALQKAKDYVNSGRIVTFGVTPYKAETGFGYIESKNELSSKDINGEEIVRFIEKPNEIKAKEFISDKRFSWNSGIFFFKASTLLSEVLNYQPDILKFCQKSLLKTNIDLDFQRLDKKYFSLCKKISFDNAIMEKTRLGTVLPLNAKWNDIGSWESMWDISEKDCAGNATLGKVIVKKTKNSYLRSENKLIVGIGIEDLIVVESNDAFLVLKKDQAQLVKDLVEELSNKGDPSATVHKTIFRPWGNYTSIAEGVNWQVKKIIVKPGESLSLQLHNHRTEHWIVVSGVALVEINGEKNVLNKNQSIYIPLGSKHRLSNNENELLTLIEIQSGDYLGEDDIIRFADKYGRKN